MPRPIVHEWHNPYGFNVKETAVDPWMSGVDPGFLKMGVVCLGSTFFRICHQPFVTSALRPPVTPWHYNKSPRMYACNQHHAASLY